jgi:NNP family nitrate/nitrite transporter-like MFS transporter
MVSVATADDDRAAPDPGGGDRPTPVAWRNLAVATVGFTLTFWAWDLIAPLATDFDEELHMSSFAQSVLVAV